MTLEELNDLDIVHDDVKVIESFKEDLFDITASITRNMECGTLASVDKSLLDIRLIALEMTLDEILQPDWKRLTDKLGVANPIPRSARYQAFIEQEADFAALKRKLEEAEAAA